MPLIEYPFSQPQWSGNEKPVLPVRIINPSNNFEWDTYALIDTGADSTVFSGLIARKLYHNINHQSVPTTVHSGIGGDVVAYLHTFSIQILHRTPNDDYDVIATMPTKTYPVIPDLEILIFGESDFLKPFGVILDYQCQKFSIQH